MLRYLTVVVMLLSVGCVVDVPEPDDAPFACNDNDDCADGYVCQGGDASSAGRCIAGSDSGDPCLPNPCDTSSVQSVCIRDDGAAGGFRCAGCEELGCNGPACVVDQASGHGRCVSVCNIVEAPCDGGTGVCVEVAGWPTPNGGPDTVLACALCDSVCPTGSCRTTAGYVAGGPIETAYECGADCTTTGCLDGNHACVEIGAGVFRCEPQCPVGTVADAECSAGVVCADVNAVGGSALICVPCDPVAAAGGCGANSCVSRNPGGGEPFDNALVCVGGGCTIDSDCTGTDLTLCRNDVCVNPCENDQSLCVGDEAACVPDNGIAERYSCVPCSPTAPCQPGNVCVQADGFGNTICRPTCDTSDTASCGGSADLACSKILAVDGSTADACASCTSQCSGSGNVCGWTTLATTTHLAGTGTICRPCNDSSACGGFFCVMQDAATGMTSCESNGACTTAGVPCDFEDGQCVRLDTPDGSSPLVCIGCENACDYGLECSGAGTYSDAAEARRDLACVCPPTPGGWQSLGNSGCSPGVSADQMPTILPWDMTMPETASQADIGSPLIGWTMSGGSGLHIESWNRNTAAWEVTATNLRQFDGTAGSISGMALGSGTGAPRVAWVENDTFSVPQVYWLQRNSVTSWIAEGFDSDRGSGITGSTGGNITWPVIDVPDSAPPRAVWIEQVSAPSVRASFFNAGGNAWEPLASPTSGGSPGHVSAGIGNGIAVQAPAVAWDGTHSYVAFITNIDDVTVHANTGSFGLPAWQSYATLLSSTSGMYLARAPSITMHNGQLVLAFDGRTDSTPTNVDYYPFVARWNAGGSIWEAMGGPGIPTQLESTPITGSTAPRLLSTGGRLFIAYVTEVDGNWGVVVREWNGTIWSNVGDVLRGFGGNPSHAHLAAGPSVLGSTNSSLCVSWYTGGAVSPGITVRCRDI